ncbi:protein ANTI-SILENCING 1-like isoform X6 [Fagus crenata]
MGGSREANLEFKWGTKRGVGQNGAVQFYESFTYDGVDYSLYDCVYMWNEPEVDIGKLVKIWEMPNRKKVVKVVWFFRPTEILRWLGDDAPLQNEIFLASGEGKGISNLNPLEVLCGKCNILCTSKDKRNPQASEVELGMADYIFYRTFDVGTCTISDNFPNAIAGIEVGYFFNRREDQKLISLSNIQANLVERSRKPTSLAKVELALAVGNGSKESKKLASGLCEQEDISDESAMLRTETFTKDSSCNQNEDIGQLVMSGDLSQKCPPDNRSLKKGKFIDSSGQSLKLHSIDSKLGNGPRSTFGKEFDTKFVFENKMVPKASVLETTDSVGQVTYNKRVETSSQFFDVTKRPDDIRRKWFKPLPWEENMQRAHEEGTLVLLENLDPSYTSSEVEDIVWQCFKEKVNGKMIQQNTFSCPHYVLICFFANRTSSCYL